MLSSSWENILERVARTSHTRIHSTSLVIDDRRSAILGKVNPLAQDTSPAQLAKYYGLLRQLTPAQRLKCIVAATRRVRMMAEGGIRLRNPTATDAWVRGELVRVLYGDEAFRRLVEK